MFHSPVIRSLSRLPPEIAKAAAPTSISQLGERPKSDDDNLCQQLNLSSSGPFGEKKKHEQLARFLGNVEKEKEPKEHRFLNLSCFLNAAL